MADQEEEDLKMALRMSMQHSPPEPKRSKPRDGAGETTVVSQEDCRRLQRELMAAAAEKRMMEAKKESPASISPVSSSKIVKSDQHVSNSPVSSSKAVGSSQKVSGESDAKSHEANLGIEEANQLFSMMFGSGVSKAILAQWSNQGIRYICHCPI